MEATRPDSIQQHTEGKNCQTTAIEELHLSETAMTAFWYLGILHLLRYIAPLERWTSWIM